MADEPEYADGTFGWISSRWEPTPVVARVLGKRGSCYHVGWLNPAGNFYDLVVEPGEFVPVTPPGKLTEIAPAPPPPLAPEIEYLSQRARPAKKAPPPEPVSEVHPPLPQEKAKKR